MIPDLKNPHPSSESIVLDVLSFQPRLSMKALYELFLQKSPKKISLQGFYALIKKMVSQRILVKEGLTLSIDASWIHALLAFADTVKATYLTNDAVISDIILREGEQRTFIFETVMAMDNFWTHALILTVYHYKQHPHPTHPDVYAYNYHSWFQLARTSQEQSLTDAYAHAGMDCYLLSGSNQFLDTLVDSNIDSPRFHHKIIQPNSALDVNTYVTLIGDVVFEMKLPNYIHEHLEKIYERVRRIGDFNPQEILQLIQWPARTTLTISHNKAKAKRYREMIQKEFDSKRDRS